jgi:hypothetical protein
VVAAACPVEPPPEFCPALPATLIFPATLLDAKTDEKAVEPPGLTLPVTTLRLLSLCVDSLVQLLGAALCWNSINVPLAINPGMALQPVRLLDVKTAISSYHIIFY